MKPKGHIQRNKDLLNSSTVPHKKAVQRSLWRDRNRGKLAMLTESH